MRTLHLDQAQNCGWAVFQDGKPVDAGVWVVKPSEAILEAREIYRHAVAQSWTVVTVEEVHSVRHAATAVRLGKLLGALQVLLGDRTVVQDVTAVRCLFGLHTNEAFLAVAQDLYSGEWPRSKKHQYDMATALMHGLYWWTTSSSPSS